MIRLWLYEQFLRIFFRRYWYRVVYLRSDHWQRFRERALKYYTPICQVKGCSVKWPLQLHHLHYRNIGREHVKDVRPLCGNHHEMIESGISLRMKDGDLLPGYRKKR